MLVPMEDTANTSDLTSESEGSGRVDQARQKLSEVGGRVGRRVSDVAKAAGERSSATREVAVDNLKAGVDRVRKDLDDLTDDVTTYVNDNPGRSVIIAAAAGFVLGLLIRGRR